MLHVINHFVGKWDTYFDIGHSRACDPGTLPILFTADVHITGKFVLNSKSICSYNCHVCIISLILFDGGVSADFTGEHMCLMPVLTCTGRGGVRRPSLPRLQYSKHVCYGSYVMY
jgi:hypothetical protein